MSLDKKAKRISQIQNELHSVIIEMTEAVNSILNIAELIDGIAQGLSPDITHYIKEQATQLFEVSEFHDITVQRLIKVINTIKILDSHLAEDPIKNETSLLNGPQLLETALHQETIDNILKR